MSLSSRFLLLLATTLPAQAAVDFQKQILPILEKRCLECHKAPFEENGRIKKPKGDLRLDAAWAMLKGGETGPALVPGDLKKSYLYEVITLPEDDDMFMPPKGGPLSQEQVSLLKEWIESGADFGGWTGNMEGAPQSAPQAKTDAPRVREYEELYLALEKDLKPATSDALEKAKAAGAQVSPLKVDGALLRADFLTGVTKCKDENIAALSGLKDHIVRLDLGRTAITDEALTFLGDFSRLVVLDLRQTQITDEGLKSLSKLSKLQTLNLFGTSITDAGLKHLASMPSLKQIYLFQTKATPAGIKQLSAALPAAKISGGK